MSARDQLQMRIDDYHRDDISRESGCADGGYGGAYAYRLTSDLVGELLIELDANEREIAKHLSDLRDARLELEQVRRLLQPAGGDHAAR